MADAWEGACATESELPHTFEISRSSRSGSGNQTVFFLLLKSTINSSSSFRSSLAFIRSVAGTVTRNSAYLHYQAQEA